MAKLLYYGTCGSNDPTKAVFPFLFACVAKEAGHEVEVTVMGEAVYLMNDGVAAATHGMGIPSASEVIQKAVGLNIPIWV
jgi:predicted peroxiredoxin